MNNGERNGNQLKGWGREAVWIRESDNRQKENVVGDSVNDITMPITAVLFRNESGGLKNKIGEEMGQVDRQKEVIGRMYHRVQ
jgi:hypothetical protein